MIAWLASNENVNTENLARGQFYESTYSVLHQPKVVFTKFRYGSLSACRNSITRPTGPKRKVGDQKNLAATECRQTIIA